MASLCLDSLYLRREIQIGKPNLGTPSPSGGGRGLERAQQRSQLGGSNVQGPALDASVANGEDTM